MGNEPVSNSRNFSNDLRNENSIEAGLEQQISGDDMSGTNTEVKNFERIKKRINEKFYNTGGVINRLAEILLKKLGKKF